MVRHGRCAGPVYVQSRLPSRELPSRRENCRDHRQPADTHQYDRTIGAVRRGEGERMAAITVKPVEDASVWEEFVTGHPEANFLQSWLWGDFYEKLGKRVHRSGFYEGGTLIGVMLSIVEPA